MLSSLNDDLWINILSRLGLGALFNVSRVCKQLYLLSHERSLLTPLYDDGHLSRAFGPSSWHSSKQIRQLLLRHNDLEKNFASAHDKLFQTTRYVTHKLDNICEHHSILICQELVFLVTESKEIICFHSDNLNFPLWSYLFTEPDHPILRCCEMIPTPTVGSWDINLIASETRVGIPVAFVLQAEKTSSGYHISQIAVQRYGSILGIAHNSVKNGWFVADSDDGAQFLLNTRSSGSYVLAQKDGIRVAGGDDIWGSSYFNEALVVMFMASMEVFTHMVVYDIPTKLPLSDSSNVIDWTHFVRYPDEWFIHSVYSVPRNTITNDGQPEITTHLHVAVETDDDFDPASADFESNSPSTINFKQCHPLPNGQLGMHRTRQYEASLPGVDEAAPVVVEHDPIFDDLEGGGFRFGKRSAFTLPCDLSAEFHRDKNPKVVFDELRGKVYVLVRSRNSCTIHVVWC